MHIILEGPDNAGKTTLAKHLIQVGGIHYFHPGGRPETDNEEDLCMRQQLSLLRQSGQIILDRITPISQQVYNPSTELLPARVRFLKEMLGTRPLVIYCRPSTDRLLRHEDFTWREGESEEHKAKIIHNAHTFVDRYDNIMREIPHVAYDFESSTGAVVRSKLGQALDGEDQALAWFQGLLNYRSF